MNQENRAEVNMDITDLKDDDIKKNIVDMNRKQLTLVRNMSYYYIIGHISKSLYDFQNGKLFSNTMTSEKRIISITLNTIIESLNKYHSNLSKDDIADGKEILINSRKELYKLVNSLHGYDIELSYIRESLDYKTMREIGREKSGDYRISKAEIDYLIERIKSFLDDETIDYNIYIKLVSNILLLIPFRMSKMKYFEVLRETLIRNFSSYPSTIVENKIEDYKKIFNSTLLDDYGILFDEYFTDIQRLKKIKLDNINSNEKEEIRVSIDNVDNRISQLKLFIIDLGIIINKLLVLYLTKEKAHSLQEDSIYLYFREFEKSQSKELLELILKNCDKRLQENEKNLSNRTKYFEKLVHESGKRGIVFEDILNDEIKNTGEVLIYYNDMKFTKHEILFAERYEFINISYLQQLIDSLIQYINRSISAMNNIERKIRMRRLMSLMELPFKNIDEFLMYVEYSFDERVVSMEEMVFTFFSLNHMIDEIQERY